MKKHFQDLVKRLILTIFLSMIYLCAFAQIRVTGVVSGTDGSPLIGATVQVKGTAQGVLTDTDGKFTINAAADAVLSVSFIGYIAQDVQVGGRTSIAIRLEEETILLSDVVVVGYATGNKRSISGAVERITAEGMNTGYSASPIAAINGKVAGLVISQNGGNVNESPTVRLRGINSLSGGNDPLVIIDGVYASITMLNNMSSQDIAEITILKDASETAQYGSRGAAGVIIATTKKGKEGVGNLSYSGQFGYSQAYKNLEVLSAAEWRDLNVTKFGGAGNDKGASTDWIDWIQNDFVSQNNHTLTFTQGTVKSNMLASVGVNSKVGQVRSSDNTTYSVRFNGSQTGLGDRLKLELNVMAFYTDRHAPIGAIWTSACNYNPTFPSYRNTTTGYWDFDPNASMATHPGEASEIEDHTESNRIMPSGRASLTIVKGLTLSAFGSFDQNNSIRKQYTPNDHYQQLSGARGSATVRNTFERNWLGNVQLTFVKDIGNHSINALALMEGQSYFTYWNQANVTGFETNVPKYYNFQSGSVVTYGNVTSNAVKYNILSYMGRINYMFNNKYVVTLNARADGSSKLGANHKWGFFPSASAAWLVTNEDFMLNQNLISNLKLRVSYGVTGNQNLIQPYQSLELEGPAGVTTYNGKPVVSYGYQQNENPDLKWETKYTFDVGLDFSMVNNRVNGTMDFYHSTTKDLLYTYTVSTPPFVYNRLLANMGEMTNIGFEAALSGEVIRSADWGLNIGGNLAFQKNKLISLHGTYKGEELTTPLWVPLVGSGGAGHTSNTNVTYMAEGYTVGLFRLPVHAGFDVDANDKRTYAFEDIDGVEGIDQGDNADRAIQGQVTPKVTASLNLLLRYKRFDLSTQLRGAFGHMIYNYTAVSLNNLNQFPSYNVLKTAPDLAIYQVIHTSYWLEKGDYTNVEYITMGYNIPTSKLKVISSARIALSCNNVVTFTGYSGLTPLTNSDPLTGGVDARNIYPILRTYTLQLSFNF
ncbi:MAG: SusC/RagA family TonB-linked outer membrane protein [Bacteroidales bacterium]|nr:SusC/RagA family TonB-linked outer membrane protein [Bacteroidales bacterium]